MGKDDSGTKRSRCVACNECSEFIPSLENNSCQNCGHNNLCHAKVVNLGICECGNCHGYTSENEFQYFDCDYCECKAEKHFGWDRVQIEIDKVRKFVDQVCNDSAERQTSNCDSDLIQLITPDFGISPTFFHTRSNLSLISSPIEIPEEYTSPFQSQTDSGSIQFPQHPPSMPELRFVTDEDTIFIESDVDIPNLLQVPLENTYLDELQGKIDLVKLELREKFEQLHKRLNQIETEKYRDLDSIFEYYDKLFTDRIRNINELEIAKNKVFKSLTQSDLQPAYAKLKLTLEKEKQSYENLKIQVPDILVTYDELSFDESLQNFCQIHEIKAPGTFFKTQPKWHEGKRGNGPKDLNHAKGLAVDPETKNLYVADCLNDRIQVYDSKGAYLRRLCERRISLPRRICINGQFLFVTSGLHQLNKINKNTGDIVEKTEFEFSLSGIDSNVVKYIYVCDLMNMQVVIVRISNLKLKRKFTLKTAKNKDTLTRDIRVTPNEIYVLFHKSPFPLQSFTHEGMLLRQIITENMVIDAKYFCLDRNNNFLVSDSVSHQIRVFSIQGEVVQVVGKKGKETPGELFEPQGVTVDSEGTIFIVDRKVYSSLQAF